MIDDRPPTKPRVAILGAGPTGLEAALAMAERRVPFTVYEAAGAAGAHVREWAHVRAFTPWSMSVSPRARRALGAAAPEGSAVPSGGELAECLLDPLARHPAIAPRLRLGARVRAVAREGLLKHEEIGTRRRGLPPFRLLVESSSGEHVDHADAVIDCTGSYSTPNRLGDGGIPAVGERALEHRIARRLPDFAAAFEEWAGRTILLTGAGHSAQTAARELSELARQAPATRVVWAIRSDAPTFGAVADDPLPERRRLTADADRLVRGESAAVEARLGRVTEALEECDGRLRVTLRDGVAEAVLADRIVALNGSVGDRELYRQLQVHECYATCGPMKLAGALLGASGADCLAQESHGAEALENPEPGFFIIGSKSYGRNSQFLLRVGWQQVDDVASLIDGSQPRAAPSTAATSSSTPGRSSGPVLR